MQYITENSLGEFQEIAFHMTFEAAFEHATECLKEHKADKKIDIFLVSDTTKPYTTVHGSNEKFRVIHIAGSTETVVGNYQRLVTANHVARDMLRISKGAATVIVSRHDHMVSYNRV